mmetsp:Transcript_4270/g.5041  ORF Transcript_4270/g.5041 Transcript_4270/m.5041 type:complete len:96 (+) Transcript_4270:268-555(+)|eukprot:CAMPEP_0185776484 /NCGR_PEP_ID=MMETSP1174-20130828/85803_1 /TAXON_ID=35687 /ORGANISM="Dictyocha speculum, Strain CCMP1381" /LENGTH=95 /DNA_ID=CAMNT_0028464447 /DNA_START=260 /DNA_END=547 /DNA_ORIENTATION=-
MEKEIAQLKKFRDEKLHDEVKANVSVEESEMSVEIHKIPGSFETPTPKWSMGETEAFDEDEIPLIELFAECEPLAKCDGADEAVVELSELCGVEN